MRRRFTVNKGFTKTFDFNNYLTIEALEDNFTVIFSNDIEYGIDGEGWIKLKSGYTTQPINAGQTLSFRGELTPTLSIGIGTFTISKKCNLKGNCMSMLFGDNASDNYSLSGKDYVFCFLFYTCRNIVTVSENFLPATTLANRCYYSMFEGCTSLTTAPALPATTLAAYCYGYMFEGCTSLTTAPELPATKLVNGCYNMMFCNCSKLNYIKALFTTTPASTNTKNWVYGVSPTGTFIKNPEATWDVVGVDGVPEGWTVKFDGEEDGGLLEFTVDGVAYQFEDGMTWYEWSNSEYNTGGFLFRVEEWRYALYTSDYEKYFKRHLTESDLVETGTYTTENVNWPIPKG